jgi:hypothetical protein
MVMANFLQHPHRLRDILAFALVSKVFSEPALDELWRVQDSLLVLIKTFPSDSWVEDGNPKTLVNFDICLLLDIAHIEFYLEFSTNYHPVRHRQIYILWKEDNKTAGCSTGQSRFNPNRPQRLPHDYILP